MTTILPLYPGLKCPIEKGSHLLGSQCVSTLVASHLSTTVKLTKNVVVSKSLFKSFIFLLTLTIDYVSFQSLRSPNEEENGYFEDDWQDRNTKLYEPRNHKRARTTSPNSGKIAANAHKNKHETMKKARMKQEMAARREIRDRKLMQEILLEVPPCSTQFNGPWFQILAMFGC